MKLHTVRMKRKTTKRKRAIRERATNAIDSKNGSNKWAERESTYKKNKTNKSNNSTKKAKAWTTQQKAEEADK